MSEYLATILPIYGKNNTHTVNTYARNIARNLTGGDTEIPIQGEHFRAMVGPKGKVLMDFRDARL